MLITEFFDNPMTQAKDGWIVMTDGEWIEFQQLTNAPFRPRSVAEFNAMCDLAAATYLTELRAEPGKNAMNGLYAISAESIKVSPDGTINFPRPPVDEPLTSERAQAVKARFSGLKLVRTVPATDADDAPSDEATAGGAAAVTG